MVNSRLVSSVDDIVVTLRYITLSLYQVFGTNAGIGGVLDRYDCQQSPRFDDPSDPAIPDRLGQGGRLAVIHPERMHRCPLVMENSLAIAAGDMSLVNPVRGCQRSRQPVDGVIQAFEDARKSRVIP